MNLKHALKIYNSCLVFILYETIKIIGIITVKKHYNLAENNNNFHNIVI